MTKIKLSPAQQRVIDLLEQNEGSYVLSNKWNLSKQSIYSRTHYIIDYFKFNTLCSLIKLNLLNEFEPGKWRLAK